ncbi:putative protein disulfide-isomerase A6 [Histomonas meleagridis]|uniref:putative protein disulfide-isomerase A6 n=1 Tax=Histomonas meleagridis TaxID=135588 RepID=UPI003559742B|nr:putative protein disulfide-isomerase A6 [Histomonas meleagridis]KAH0806086.1 putative protein disulfide-isomerase A6 [Histomonas meleagridis]
MLRFCHCLCSKEYDALTRVSACYPTDGRSDPVAARVRELIHWGTHDISRLSSIHDILAERIRRDIAHNKVNSVAVGIKILCRLLEDVSEINLNISDSLTSSILLLIKTKNISLIEIANCAITILLKNTQQVSLSKPVNLIVREYLKLCSDESVSDVAYQSLSEMITQTSINLIPIEEVLREIKDEIGSNNNARDILASLAKSTVPLSLPTFSEAIFRFFDETDMWSDATDLSSFMLVLFTEMGDVCTPPFFRLWLEHLIPQTADNRHSLTIITVAGRLMESIPSSKLLSTTQTDPLLMIFSFILKVPSLQIENKKEIYDLSFNLARSISTNFDQSELAKEAHSQIWKTLPVETTSEYDDDQIELIFKFATLFNEAIPHSLNKEMVNSSLNCVYRFLISRKKHAEIIFTSILHHLKSLIRSHKFCRFGCVLPFLFALQDYTIQNHKLKIQLPLHTFIICAMFDAVKEGPSKILHYVNEIAKKRIESKPPMIDTTLTFAKKYFPKAKKLKKSSKLPKEITLIDLDHVFNDAEFHRKEKKQFKQTMIDIVKDDDDVETETEEEENDEFHESEDIPMIVYQQGEESGEEENAEVLVEDNRSKKEKKKAKKSAIKNAVVMELKEENFNRTINNPIPTIVRYYSAHRRYSLALDEQYDILSQMFEGVDGIRVAVMNCGKYRHFCYEQGISMTPVVKLYTQDAVHTYDGGMSHESIARWATAITGVHPIEIIQTLLQPNGRVFKELLNKTHCVFVMFYNPWCVSCKKFLPSMREVAEAFKYDDRVQIVANDVDLYKFYNWDYDLKLFPDLRLYCHDESDYITYSGKKTAEDLIDFINDYCGTQRGLNGRLNSEAGIIDEVSQTVEDFITKGKKQMYLNEMKQVEGTKYYQWVMEEIIQKGEKFVAEERERLNKLLDSGTLAPDKIDEFQIRVNILGVFASYIDDE